MQSTFTEPVRTASRLGERGGPGGPGGLGGGTGGGRPARRVDPADRAQLAESPVPWPRVAALFRPHR